MPHLHDLPSLDDIGSMISPKTQTPGQEKHNLGISVFLRVCLKGSISESYSEHVTVEH